jgi:hypothetical protein
MRDKQQPHLTGKAPNRNWLRLGLITGAVLLGVLATCVVAWGIYTLVGRSGSDIDQYVRAPGAPPEPAADMAGGAVEMPAAEPEMASSSYGTRSLAQAIDHLIIRTGSISMVVEDTRGAQATIEDMVAGMAGEGAFVVSSNEYGGDEEGQPHITLSIRIPAARFDETMDRLADMAVTVTSRDESAQDVTEEYVDLEARLESLEAARQRLLDIMAEARTTKDLLEAEQQLTQREAEIESIKGRMQYLEESAQLSSIWIELQPYILSQPVGDQWRPAETARRAVDALLDGLRGFGDFLIFFAIAVLPWLVAIGLVIFVIVRLIRWRIRARRAAAQASGEPPRPSDHHPTATRQDRDPH